MFAVAARRSILCWQQTAFTNDKAPLPGSRGHGLQLNLEILEFTQASHHIETIYLTLPVLEWNA